MSVKAGVAPEGGAVLLMFRDRYTSSPQFLALFQQGMLLVEETAEYLDAQGRHDAKKLVPPASLAYTTESMKLTTRLMQMASWLLLRRAIANGEVTMEQAQAHKRKVRLSPQSSAQSEGFDSLPPKLRYLISESHRLHERLVRLDRTIGDESNTAVEPASPVNSQISRIRLAFP